MADQTGLIKVVFIIPSFRVGGVDRVMGNIMNSLDSKLYEVTLIVCIGDHDYNRLLKSLKPHVKVVVLNKENFRSALRPMTGVINDIKPSIVFTSHNHVGLAVLLYRALCFKKFKVITRISTLPSNNIAYVFREKIYNAFFKYFLSKANAVIAQSEEMKQEIIRHYWVNQKKVFAIRNLVDKDYVLRQAQLTEAVVIKDPAYFTFVAVGALSEVKGFDLLIDAVKIVIDKEQNQPIRLFIVGGNLREIEDFQTQLQEQINRLGLDKIVYLLGFKENPYYYIKQADAFVLSSRKEGFPNVVLEALVLGKPCLVTNCVNFDGIIDTTNGVVVEKDNVQALAEGLQKVQIIDGQKASELTNFDYNLWLSSVQ